MVKVYEVINQHCIKILSKLTSCSIDHRIRIIKKHFIKIMCKLTSWSIDEMYAISAYMNRNSNKMNFINICTNLQTGVQMRCIMVTRNER